MGRQRQDRRNQAIAHALEHMTGKSIPTELHNDLFEGGSDIELVRSGLEEVMRSPWLRLSNLLEAEPELKDYRTATYVAATREVALPMKR